MAESTVLSSRVTDRQWETPSHPRIPSLTLKNLFTGPIQVAPLTATDSAPAALAKLLEHHLTALPVVDDQRICGTFSLEDVAKGAGNPGGIGTASVAQLMSRCDRLAALGDPAHAAWRWMDDTQHDYLPVQGDDGIGLLSRAELLREMVIHYQKIFREMALDQQVLFLRGTYSC